MRVKTIILVSLTLAACNLPSAFSVTEPAVDEQSTAVTAAETGTPTSPETPPPNLIRLGELELIPFTPPWFEGDLAKTVFAENGLLRIDSPEELGEPDKNMVTGVVTPTSYESFEISATFNAEGGVCRAINRAGCGNIFVYNCIVFDFVDFEDMQIFCISASGPFWMLIAYENGTAVFHSSAHKSEAIHNTSIISYEQHPVPNEIRLILRDGQLTAIINGEQVFSREDPTSLVGYDASGMPVHRTNGWMSEPIHGQIGAGCVNVNHHPFWRLANCEISLVIGP